VKINQDLYKVFLQKSDLANNLFYQRLDLSNGVGLLGHSFGSTITLLMTEKRPKQTTSKTAKPRNKDDLSIACAAVMDPWLFPIYSLRDKEIRQLRHPLMFVNSDLWLSKPEDLGKLESFYTAQSKGVYAITLKGITFY
jgi:hypothetical protein